MLQMDNFKEPASKKANDNDDENSSLNSTIVNDPDFAIICSFFQKFSPSLGVNIPNFRQLQQSLINTDEVSPLLRDLHIKLLRKTRKTVHEKRWEGALSKFCFTYSSKDAWEIERFGYKKSSLKVKLRILRELLESQFERNAKFRAHLLTLSAESLRAKPIGKDRLGHSYWLTVDDDCNLRIYQEHLDEDTWQVVASSREELVSLITRLRGNEVVLPSTDIGTIDEDTSSSNSNSTLIPKPPPPVEADDSQEEENTSRVPSIFIKLGTTKSAELETSNICDEKKISNNIESSIAEATTSHSPQKRVKPIKISQKQINGSPTASPSNKKRYLEEAISSDASNSRETHGYQKTKKHRLTLLDSKHSYNKLSEKLTKPADTGESKSSNNTQNDEVNFNDFRDDNVNEDIQDEDIDSAAAEEDENEEKEIEESDNEDDKDKSLSTEITDPTVFVQGEGCGADCASVHFLFSDDNDQKTELEFSDVIEEPIMLIFGLGEGADCGVGNKSNSINTTNPIEKKATFFFGEPGCLKLSPVKQAASPVNHQKSTPSEELLKSATECEIKDSQNENAEEIKFTKENENKNATEDIRNDNTITANSENKPDPSKIQLDDASSLLMEKKGTNIHENHLHVEDRCHGQSEIIEEPELTGDPSLKSDDQYDALKESKPLIDAHDVEVVKPSKIEIISSSLNQNDVPASAISTNRKRRMNNSSANSSNCNQHSFSEGESDKVPSDSEDVGGKRQKMRSKSINIHIRKKVEARKATSKNEECASSSGDEETKAPVEHDKSVKPDNIVSNLNESTKAVISDTKAENSITHKNVETNTQPTIASKPEVKISPISNKKNSNMKQKPSLSDIIEKRLKKCSDQQQSVSTASDCPKKSPITKPLKKNLLTQIRQQEHEEKEIKKPTETKLNEIESQNKPIEKSKPAHGFEAADKASEITHGEEESIKSEKKAPVSSTVDSSVIEEKGNISREMEKEQSALCLESNLGADENEAKKEQIKNDSEDDIEEERDFLENKSSKLTEGSNSIRRSSRRVTAAPTTNYNTSQAKKNSRISHKNTETGKISKVPGSNQKDTLGDNEKTKKISAKTKNNEHQDLNTVHESKVEKSEIKHENKSDSLNSSASSSVPEESVSLIPVLKSSPKSEEKPENTTSTGESKKVDVNRKQRGAGTSSGAVIRKKREAVDASNIIDANESEAPVRQSRRIALQKIKEEAERRKLEEIALRTMKQEFKKRKKAEKKADLTVEEFSNHTSSSDDESEKEIKKKRKKKCPGKGGWSSGSEEKEEPDDEDEDHQPFESDNASLVFKSDHEFSPESELEDESQIVPMKRARTARKEDAEEDDDAGDEENCQKCGKSDHPEWILLCDNCDKGYHCSCLSPVLFYIPEGDWYCPPCQQAQLIKALEEELQKYDELVQRKRIELEEETKRLLEEEAEKKRQAEFEEEERQKRKNEKKSKTKRKKRNLGTDIEDNSEGDSEDDVNEVNGDSDGKRRDSSDNDSSISTKEVHKKSHHLHSRTRRRKAAKRGDRRRRRNECRSSSDFSRSGTSSEDESESESSSASNSSDSDNVPIYKLRKRRQINVSYRLNEYDDMINSALKKEMDELAGAGNLGRGKDITTIIEADREEKARLKKLEESENLDETDKKEFLDIKAPVKKTKSVERSDTENVDNNDENDEDDKPLRAKNIKKKARKLTTLDITSEEDDGSDEDFKTSSLGDEEEDSSISVSDPSDSSLEIYKRRNKRGETNKRSKRSRRAARERRKDRRFVIDDSDDDEDNKITISKKKQKNASDYTESETGDDLSELSENIDSADLCDDTSTDDDSDGGWHPSARKKQRNTQKPSNTKKSQPKKAKKMEFSDDDISESDLEDDDEQSQFSGKGSGKQPRSQPLIPVNTNKSESVKNKVTLNTKKKPTKNISERDDSGSDSADSLRRTRGRRYAYIEDFDDDSSDGGIKPGVKRPDTPPEERERFIKRQEEIKRMLAEKNAEGAKLAATPRLTPIKSAGDKDKRSPFKPGDSLSTVPLSVIRQAKVLDIDYLQRKGESIPDIENAEEDEDVASDFDAVDLPDELPEDVDEDAIARMVEEEDGFSTATAPTARDLPAADEVVKTPNKSTKSKDGAVLEQKPSIILEPPVAHMSISAQQLSTPSILPSGLQEAVRKRLPMPTIHPSLLRLQHPNTHPGMGIMHLSQAGSSQFLQHALTATPMSQPLSRSLNIPRLSHPQSFGNSELNQSESQPSRHPPAALSNTVQASSATSVNEPKPRGRRKKITPLRDAMQKQQSAAVIPSPAGNLSIPPKETSLQTLPTNESNNRNIPPPIPPAHSSQLYKPPPASSEHAGSQHTSVITRIPAHLGPTSKQLTPPTSLVYQTPPDVARFYSVLHSATSGIVTRQSSPSPSSMQRIHRGPLQLPSNLSPSHSLLTNSIRPTYGAPPPLRGGISAPSGSIFGSQRTGSGIRSQFLTEHGTNLSTSPYGAPLPPKHAPSHLNPYRPHIFGSPNYPPRGAPPPGVDYSGPYSPYGYYPPPPPLTTSHHPPPQAAHHSSVSSASLVTPTNSVIVAASSSRASIVVPNSVTTPSATESSSTANKLISNSAENVVTKQASSESVKKLITLDTYSPTPAKSPVMSGGDSSGSQVEANDTDSVVISQKTSDSAQSASEFSGLVSYFSSQHDDYNT